MDLELDITRKNYALCRAGFAWIAIGLGLLCLSSSLFLFMIIGRNVRVFNLLNQPWWAWAVGAPITWTTLIGSYLLWGRWPDPVWQRRAGALVLMNLIHLVLWGLEHNTDLGLRIGNVGHVWFRQNLAEILNWLEFALFAHLAADMLAHLGDEGTAVFGHSVRLLAIGGALFWAFVFVSHTNWARGWPLVPRGRLSQELVTLTEFLTLSVAIQTVALNYRAYRACSSMLETLRPEAEADDLLISRSEKEWNETSGRR